MTLPGVIDTSNREAPGSTGGLSINGQTSIAFAYDGITSKDTGSNGGNFARPALDSIAEIKLQASNFQAEYGRSSGATIVVVTKSGSRDFRGSVAYFRRDDALNSNTWERERDCAAGQTGSCKPALYEYNNATYTFGGPGRSCREPIQQGTQQAVLLLVARHAAAHGPGQPVAGQHADRARARRRLLADARQPGTPRVHPRSADESAVQRDVGRRRRLLRGQRHSRTGSTRSRRSC